MRDVTPKRTKQQQEHALKMLRHMSVTRLRILADCLEEGYKKRDLKAANRTLRSMLGTIVGIYKVEPNMGEGLAKKLENCGVTHTEITVSEPQIKIEGTFDLRKLAKEIVW